MKRVYVVAISVLVIGAIVVGVGAVYGKWFEKDEPMSMEAEKVYSAIISDYLKDVIAVFDKYEDMMMQHMEE